MASFPAKCTAALLLISAAAVAESTSYRWVDDNGVTHYSDQVPPEAAKQERAKLSEQGRELLVIEAAKSSEQLRREQQLRLLRSKQDKLLAEQRDRDLALLRTYRSIEEMARALDAKLATLDSAAKITEANRQRQKDIAISQEQKAAEMERTGQPVPQSQRDLISATRRQIANYDEKLRDIQADKDSLANRFKGDMIRFKRLRDQQQSAASLRPDRTLFITNDRSGGNDIVISAIACSVGTVCNRAWDLAREYLAKHSNQPLSMETEKILRTAPPKSDSDFSMTVTRIADKSEEILFLDVQCVSSSIGEALCASQKVRELRADFRPFIEAGIGQAGAGTSSLR